MMSQEARAHEAARRETRDNPPELPAGVDVITFSRRVADLFLSWASDPEVPVEEAKAGESRALWIGDEAARSKKVLLYFHGGAYVIGTADHVASMVGHIVKGAGCRALSVDYRLAPEHPFPAGLEDATAAYRWLLEHDHDPGDIVVGGDSAGGGLSLATVLSARDEGLPLPSGILAISPWGDLACTGASWSTNADHDMILGVDRLTVMAHLYADGDQANPLASPALADYSGLPPIYVQASGHETVLDDSLEIAARAARAGVDVRLDVFPGMQHVFQYCVGNMPEADDAIARIAAWISGL